MKNGVFIKRIGMGALSAIFIKVYRSEGNIAVYERLSDWKGCTLVSVSIYLCSQGFIVDDVQ